MKYTEGKVKVLTNDVKNLTQALEGYIKKAFEEGKDLCASVGLVLKTTGKLSEKVKELKEILPQVKKLSDEARTKAEEAIKKAEEALSRGQDIKSRLKEFEAATNVYKKNPTEENRKRVEKALEGLNFPEGGTKTLRDYVEACNPYRKYIEKRVKEAVG